jgi:cytochrome c peroxidase
MRVWAKPPFHAAAVIVCLACEFPPDPIVPAALDARLTAHLAEREFTGRIESTLEARLGRPIDPHLAEVGRFLFFDPILSLTGDNSCSGCHGPNVSFNDSRSIAIGVGNNGVVGPGRRGPHNQRRAPSVVNAAFFPRLMWDSRFHAASIDPFRNENGFSFPPPENFTLSHMEHLLGAQAFTPVVNRAEMAGSFAGDHDDMRAAVVRRVSAIQEYRKLFGEVFPDIEAGKPLGFEHIATALAEFQFTLVRADAPIDRFARGETHAMTPEQKQGALLFFGRANCGECHIVSGFANEMFSDFEPHVLGVPQVVATDAVAPFDGPGANEDYGLERVTGREADRYKFRTQPLRNAVFQPSYMHNGAYVCLSHAIRHHLDVFERVRSYRTDHLEPSLRGPLGPTEPVLARVHEFIRRPPKLSEEEFEQILAFVRDALTDPDAAPEALRSLVPASVPSGLPVHRFDFSASAGGEC